MRVSVTADVRAAQARLRRLVKAGHDLRPVWRDSRKAVRDDQKDHGKKQEGPEGGWKPLAASTIAQRSGRRRRAAELRKGVARRRLSNRRRRRKTASSKRVLGRLPYLLDTKITSSSLFVISQVPWSGVQQSGGRAGKRARIPARPFLWLSHRVIILTVNKVEQHLLDAWRKG